MSGDWMESAYVIVSQGECSTDLSRRWMLRNDNEHASLSAKSYQESPVSHLYCNMTRQLILVLNCFFYFECVLLLTFFTYFKYIIEVRDLHNGILRAKEKQLIPIF